jgi:hypothetical protein
MKLKLAVLALVAALAPASALADTTPKQPHARGIVYTFAGQLLDAPSSSSIPLAVQGGNHAALKAMLGSSVNQAFSYDSSTEFLLWQNGIPKVVSASDLHQGDWVRVNIRAPRGATLQQIEQQAPGIVGDHVTEPTRPDNPLYLFRGAVVSTGSSSVTVDVGAGNRRALRLLIGQSGTQTFTTGDQTIFLLWQGKVPSVISLADLKAGDKVVVRVRAAAHSTLAQVESTAAVRVGEHEPRSSDETARS